MKLDNKKKLLISAFIIPVLIIVIYLIYMEFRIPGYFKKGENMLLADMSSQYNSLYAYVHDVLTGRASIFYSFSKGLGGNMASTIGYYLGSPFNLFYAFFPKNLIPLCTFIIYTIKIGLCGSFMFYFLHKRLKVENPSLLIFSTAYALCAYTVNYYFNNMWLDVVLLTPLVMHGINNIFEKKKITFYTVTLAIAIIANFYISYMLAIFCVIYFLFETIVRYNVIKDFKEVRKCFFKFAIGSLLAGGIACIMLLPAIYNLSQIFRTPLDERQLHYDTRGLKNTIFNDILSKLYIGSHSKESTLSRNRPNIYFGLISFVLCYFYYFNGKIKIKEKITSFFIMAIFFLSFFIPQMNLFWHGFSFPNGYICRFSFLFCFFMIFIAARTFYNINKIRIIPSVIFIAGYIWIAKYIMKQYLVFLEHSDVIASCVFVCIYIVALFVISRATLLKRKLLILLTICSLVEVYINFSDCFLTNQSIKIMINYDGFYQTVCPTINKLDNDFYRIDTDYYFSYLDGMLCDTYGVTTSLSTNDQQLYKSLYDYGLPLTYTTVRLDLNKTPTIESVLGVKYAYSQDNYEDTYYLRKEEFTTIRYDYVNKRWKEKKLYLYENPYALSFGFLVNKNYFSLTKKSNSNNPYENINKLYKSLSGNDKDIFYPYDIKSLGNNIYEVDINNDTKYLYLAYDYPVSINWTTYESIYINDMYVSTPTSEDIGTIKVPNKYANQKIKIRIGMDNYSYNPRVINDFYAYWFDQEQFEKDIEILRKHPIENLKIKNNKVKFDVTSDKNNNIVFLSIPYDKAWDVYVDGKKVNPFNMANGFIGIKFEKTGKHTVTMKYVSPYFRLGLLISLVSVSLLIIYEKKICKKQS